MDGDKKGGKGMQQGMQKRQQTWQNFGNRDQQRVSRMGVCRGRDFHCCPCVFICDFVAVLRNSSLDVERQFNLYAGSERTHAQSFRLS